MFSAWFAVFWLTTRIFSAILTFRQYDRVAVFWVNITNFFGDFDDFSSITIWSSRSFLSHEYFRPFCGKHKCDAKILQHKQIAYCVFLLKCFFFFVKTLLLTYCNANLLHKLGVVLVRFSLKMFFLHKFGVVQEPILRSSVTTPAL
jgi:hypothetical protein